MFSYLTELEHQGFAVLDNQLTLEQCKALVQLGKFTYPMQPAGTGRGSVYQKGLLRGDRIHWLSGEQAEEKPVIALFDSVRQTLNERFYLGLASTEAHLACYEPGKGYKRHKDTFADQTLTQRRKISTVLYLNPHWTENDGGQLRLYPEGKAIHDILPVAGRLVMFLSEEMEHEVLPAHQERWSIAGWHLTR